ALLDELGIASAALVGNSMGGFIGAELALAAPQRVDRLVLVAPAGISSAHSRRAPLVTLARRMAAVGTWTAAHADSFARRARLRKLLLRLAAAHPDRLP